MVQIQSICMWHYKFEFFKRVENSVGKGENADYEHFLLFTQFFQAAFYTGL